MNDMIKSMVQPLLDAFDAYQIQSDAVRTEVENFKNELKQFAESHDDFMQYYNDFSSSGLQEKYTDLISKVATMSYAADAAADSGAVAAADSSASAAAYSDADAATSSAPSISVCDFLEQYRVPYEEVEKRDSRATKVYEEIFAIADKTDDMIEAQLILEKERLLWRIVKEDALDTFERKLKEMDPLYLATTAVLLS